MKTNLGTRDFTDRERRAIRAHAGRSGRATRREIVSAVARMVDAWLDDLAAAPTDDGPASTPTPTTIRPPATKGPPRRLIALLARVFGRGVAFETDAIAEYRRLGLSAARNVWSTGYRGDLRVALRNRHRGDL